MDFDIYADLDFDLGKRYEELQKQNEELTEKIGDLEKKASSLKDELVEVKSLNELLQLNISRLYNTAVNELKRKNRELAETRKELDDFIIKRAANGMANKENHEYNDLLWEYKKKCEQLRDKDKFIDDLKSKLAAEVKKVEELRKNELKSSSRKRSYEEDSNDERSAKKTKMSNTREETSDLQDEHRSSYRNKGYMREDRYFNNRESRRYEPQNFDSRHEQYFESRYRNRRYISPNRDRAHFEHPSSRNKYYPDYSYRLKDSHDYRNYKVDMTGAKHESELHTPKNSDSKEDFYCEGKWRPPPPIDTKTHNDWNAAKRAEIKPDYYNESKVKVATEGTGCDREMYILKQNSQHEAKSNPVETEGQKYENEPRPKATIETNLESRKKPIETDNSAQQTKFMKLGEDSVAKVKVGKKLNDATERKSTAILPVPNVNIYMKRMKAKVLTTQLVKQTTEENKTEIPVETDVNPNTKNSSLTEVKANVKDEVCETERKKIKLDTDETKETVENTIDVELNKTKCSESTNSLGNVSNSKLERKSNSESEVKKNVEIPRKMDEINLVEKEKVRPKAMKDTTNTVKELKISSDIERTSTVVKKEVKMSVKKSLQDDGEKDKSGKKYKKSNSLSKSLSKNSNEVEKQTISEPIKLKEQKKSVDVTISLKNQKVRTISGESGKQKDEKSAVKDVELNFETKKLKGDSKSDERGINSELEKNDTDSSVKLLATASVLNIEKQSIVASSEKKVVKNVSKEETDKKIVATNVTTGKETVSDAVQTKGHKKLQKNKKLKTSNMDFEKQRTSTSSDEKSVKEQDLHSGNNKLKVQPSDTKKSEEKNLNFEVEKNKIDNVEASETVSGKNIEEPFVIPPTEKEIVKNPGKEKKDNRNIVEFEATNITTENEIISDSGKSKEYKKIPGIKISLKKKVKTMNTELEKQNTNTSTEDNSIKEYELQSENKKPDVQSTDTNKSDEQNINFELQKSQTNNNVEAMETAPGINIEKQRMFSPYEKEIVNDSNKEEQHNKNLAEFEATNVAVEKQAISDAVKTKEHKKLPGIKISLKQKKVKTINIDLEKQKSNTPTDEKSIKEQELNSEVNKPKLQSPVSNKFDQRNIHLDLEKNKIDKVEVMKTDSCKDIEKQSIIASTEKDVAENLVNEEKDNKNITEIEATDITIQKQPISAPVKPNEHKRLPGIKISLKNKKVKMINMDFEKTNTLTDENELTFESKILKVQPTDTNKSEGKNINSELEKNEIDNNRTLSDTNIENHPKISSSESELIKNSGKEENSNLCTSLKSAEKNVHEPVAIAQSESNKVEQKKGSKRRRKEPVKYLKMTTRSSSKLEREIGRKVTTCESSKRVESDEKEVKCNYTDERNLQPAVLLDRMKTTCESINLEVIHEESLKTVGEKAPDTELSTIKYEKSVEQIVEVTLPVEKEATTSDNQQQENKNRSDMKSETAEATVINASNKQKENKYCEIKLKEAESILADTKKKNENVIVGKDLSKYDLAGLEKTRENILLKIESLNEEGTDSVKENVGTNAGEQITELNFCSLEEKMAQLHTSPKSKIKILKIEHIDTPNRIDVRKMMKEVNRNATKDIPGKEGFLEKVEIVPENTIESKKTSETNSGRRSKEKDVDGKREAVVVSKRTSGQETELCLVETDVAPENKEVEKDNKIGADVGKEKKSKESVTENDEVAGNINTSSETVQPPNTGSRASSSSVSSQPEKEGDAATVTANADQMGTSPTASKKPTARRRRCVITIK